jgi:hypothetical protein
MFDFCFMLDFLFSLAFVFVWFKKKRVPRTWPPLAKNLATSLVVLGNVDAQERIERKRAE